MTAEPLTEKPHDTEAEYLTGIAALRLEHLIAQAIGSYRVQPDVRPSKHIAIELIKAHPGVLDAVRGGR